MSSRIVIIGHGLFRDGLTQLLLEDRQVEIVGVADRWSKGKEIVARQRPDILIVDHATARLQESDLAPLLESDAQKLKVIYLTLAENKMIVHDQQHFSDVTLNDLLNAMRKPETGESQPEHE